MILLKNRRNPQHAGQNEKGASSQTGGARKISRKKAPSAPVRLALPLSEIILPQPSPRAFTPGDTVALAASIERVGQLCPVCVREKGGKYHLLDGERRLRALMLLNAPTVDACVIKTSLSREQFFLAAHSGAPLHPIEKARIFERVQKSGPEPSALNLGSLSPYAQLNKLPERVQRLLMEIPPEQLPPRDLLCALAALPEKDCARALKLLLDKLNDSRLYAKLLKTDSDSSGIFQSLRATQLYADNRLYFNSLMDILNALERNGCTVQMDKAGPEEYRFALRSAQPGEQLHMSVQTKAI